MRKAAPKDQTVAKTQAAPHPDRAAFRVFMGTFFVLAGIPSAFFSFRHFQDHQHHLKRVQHFRQNPESVPDGSTAQSLIAMNQSMADRDWLTAIVIGIASLVFFSIAIRLFVLAAKSRGEKLQFATIDWQTIPKPTRRVEVHYKRVYEVLFVFLAIF